MMKDGTKENRIEAAVVVVEVNKSDFQARFELFVVVVVAVATMDLGSSEKEVGRQSHRGGGTGACRERKFTGRRLSLPRLPFLLSLLPFQADANLSDIAKMPLITPHSLDFNPHHSRFLKLCLPHMCVFGLQPGIHFSSSIISPLHTSFNSV